MLVKEVECGDSFMLSRSGWLRGEKFLAGKAALAEVSMNKGRVILFGFRPQHRGQTWGTFQFIFNAIMHDNFDCENVPSLYSFAAENFPNRQFAPLDSLSSDTYTLRLAPDARVQTIDNK
jgi:hypothetical protein